MNDRDIRVLIDERDRRYEERFKAQEKAVSAALQAAKEAVEKAEVASEKRFDAVNEFRAQQQDIIALFLPRQEYHVQHEALVEKVDKLATDLHGLASAAAAIREFKTYLIGLAVFVTIVAGIAISNFAAR